jgi:23S rRNA U2552 (ribose-2'-O)-methylase RlmE/FtsJ
MIPIVKWIVRRILGEVLNRRLTVQYWRLRNRVHYSYDRELDNLHKWVSSGDLVVDVGANMGQYSSALKSLVGPTGRVVAFEASPSTAVLTGAILKNLGVEFHAKITSGADRSGGSF